jgi:hypothetical protein
MKNLNVAFVFITILLISCSTTKNRGKLTVGEGGVITGGQIKVYCDPPQKQYAKEVEAKLLAEISELKNIPEVKLETSLNSKVIKLADYSSQGLDRDLLLFRICEMSVNRGLSNEQTKNLIDKAIKVWDEETKTN